MYKCSTIDIEHYLTILQHIYIYIYNMVVSVTLGFIGGVLMV